jgi:very-short-patch-repair endonuclease/predicted transcriptional regulator of viral defense system
VVPRRETGTYGRLDAEVANLAADQHLVFSLEDLRDLGLSPSAVHKRTASGRLHRVHRAVYSLVPRDQLPWRGRYLAAVLACGDGAVVSHREAAALHDLRPSNREGIDVLVPWRRAPAVAGLTVHTSRTLTDDDVTEVDGIPCTTIARTHLDLAAVVGLQQTERALNQAEAMGVFDLRALHDQLHRNPHAPGASQLCAALELYQPETAPTESDIEDAFVDLCRAHNLSAPERQVWFTLDDGEEPFRADFVWRGRRVVLEADSRTFHGTARAFEADRRRDQRLARAGWRTVRVTRRQLRDQPATVVELVRDLLSQATAPRTPTAASSRSRLTSR